MKIGVPFHISEDNMKKIEASTKELHEGLDSIGFYELPDEEQRALIRNALGLSFANRNSGVVE